MVYSPFRFRRKNIFFAADAQQFALRYRGHKFILIVK